MMKTFLLFVPFYFIILITGVTVTEEILRSSRYIENNNLFELLNNSTGENLPQFVVLPNITSENDTFEVKYKSFSKIFTRNTSSKWILSVHVDQHFFYNNKYDEPLHALCYLQFSVERIINHIYKNASCKITFRLNNIPAITNCSLQIGRPPSICSAYFNLSEINFYNHSPTWASISAELYFPPSETIITSSINQPSFQFNSSYFLNWTVVQTNEIFGNLFFGLPTVSIKTGTSLKMPFSIFDTHELNIFDILIEYSSCLSLDDIESLNETRWKIENEDVENTEIRFFRFELHRLDVRVDKSDTKRNQEEIALLKFNVSETQMNGTCWIRAGIIKATTFKNENLTCFLNNTFREYQKPITIPIDSNDFTMITFPEPHLASIKLHSSFSTLKQIFNQIYTYFLDKSGDLYVPRLIKNVTCESSKFSRGIANKDCVPRQFSDSWVLSMQVEQRKAVVFNTFNIWQPEQLNVFLSDSELNPIVDWLVFRNQTCLVLHQSTYLKVGTRFNTFNSFGMRIYLGSSSRDEKPWIDISKKINFSEILYPSHVLSPSRNAKGTILINVITKQKRTFYLFTRIKIFPHTELTVVRDPWVSVVKIIGKCISHVDINKIQSHPSSEGQFLNYEIKLKKLQIGEQCNLFLGVVFNDTTQIWLEDLSHQDYRLNVNGKEFKNGNLITYQLKMYVILYGSSLCGNSTVARGEIDLSSDLLCEKSQENIISTKVSTQTMPIIIPIKLSSEIRTTSESKVKQKHSLSIVIYCVIGVVDIALCILLLNYVIRFNARRHLIANKQRRLSQSGNDERQNKQTKRLNSQKPYQDHYYSLLPPPGPLIPSNEHTTDLVISLQSETGLENSSSLGSQKHDAALSTFGTPITNRSMHILHSSSCIYQTLQSFNEVIQNNSSNMYPAESSSPQFEPQYCISSSYLSDLKSNYIIPYPYQVFSDNTLNQNTRHDHI